ncbi:MAG: hypothetical protein MJY49_00080 [Bacteroidales bacterium]|nr:hypothetical protein [Bacteroidales bacterium]
MITQNDFEKMKSDFHHLFYYSLEKNDRFRAIRLRDTFYYKAEEERSHVLITSMYGEKIAGKLHRAMFFGKQERDVQPSDVLIYVEFADGSFSSSFTHYPGLRGIEFIDD